MSTARRTAQRTPADAAESSSCWAQTRRVELDAWNQRVLHGWPPLLNWRMLCYEVESSSKEIWRPSEDVENRKRFQVADSSRAYTSTECQDYISRITLSVSYFIYTGNKRQPEKTGDTGEKAARNGLVTGGKRQLLLPFFVRGHQNSYRTQ